MGYKERKIPPLSWIVQGDVEHTPLQDIPSQQKGNDCLQQTVITKVKERFSLGHLHTGIALQLLKNKHFSITHSIFFKNLLNTYRLLSSLVFFVCVF